MTDVLRTSPERPIIWSPGRPTTRSCRRPVDVTIYNFCILVFLVKNNNSCVKQRLLYLKNNFFCQIINLFVGPLRVPWRSRTLEPLGDLQGTSPARRVPAGIFLCEVNFIAPGFFLVLSEV